MIGIVKDAFVFYKYYEKLAVVEFVYKDVVVLNFIETGEEFICSLDEVTPATNEALELLYDHYQFSKTQNNQT